MQQLCKGMTSCGAIAHAARIVVDVDSVIIEKRIPTMFCCCGKHLSKQRSEDGIWTCAEKTDT